MTKRELIEALTDLADDGEVLIEYGASGTLGPALAVFIEDDGPGTRAFVYIAPADRDEARAFA